MSDQVEKSPNDAPKKESFRERICRIALEQTEKHMGTVSDLMGKGAALKDRALQESEKLKSAVSHHAGKASKVTNVLGDLKSKAGSWVSNKKTSDSESDSGADKSDGKK